MTTPPPLPDRRAYPRQNVIAQAQVSRAGEVYVLACHNLSLGGAYCEGSPEDCPEMTLGAPVELAVFREGGAPTREAVVQARVVRIDAGGAGRPPGFGLVFESLEPEERRRLEAIIDGR